MKNIIDTLEYAQDMHSSANAMDKTGNTPYYWHLLRVMLRLHDVDEDCKKVCLLHDVLEDTKATYEELEKLFGTKIANNVKWCSKNYFPDLSFNEWMTAIANEAPDDVILAKLADISDNLSFERMRGLMPSKSNMEKIKPEKPITLQQRVDILTRKKMKLRGEMGVYDRYYKAWNIILANPKNHKFLSQVETGDFVNYEQLKELFIYIKKNEFENYLKQNKIHTWKISGAIEIHHDKNGTPYLAASISSDIGLLYQGFLANHQKNEYLINQQKRDNNSFHVTLINAADYSKIKKDNNLNLLESLIEQKNIDFYSYGIGMANKNQMTAYFVVLENNEINTFRNKLLLKNQDLHMTLGFEPKDVHGVSKNKSTIQYKNDDIWNFFVNNNFTHIKEKSRLNLSF